MNLILPATDRLETIKRYSMRYKEFGYSPKSLGWDKGKQDVRFNVLTSHYDFTDKAVLDVGCGFGDLNKTLFNKYGNRYSYLGIDLVPDLISEARERYTRNGIDFNACDFLAVELERDFDYVVASGIFNHRLSAANNYELIEATMAKAFSVARDGLAFDFLSDKVDYQLEHTFHSSPEKILAMAYKYSRNVVLRNDYMPFEFAVFIIKDDSFSSDDTLFNRYKAQLL